MKTNFYLFIMLIVIVISFLLFNDKGNALTKPHLEKFLNEQLSEGEHVDIANFSVDLNSIKATLLYNKTSTIDVVGSYSLLMQSFDLKYRVSLKEFKYKNIELKEQVDATGHAVGSYNISDKALQMAYDVNISDLSKLQPITKQKLYGSMFLKGQIDKERVTGETKELDGQLNFQLDDGHFTMQMDRLSMEKVMNMLHYPSVFKASIIGEGEYKLKEERGVFVSTLVDAQLLPNDFIELVKNFNGLDLSKETFKESNLTATIEKKLINIEFLAQNDHTTIELSPARIKSDTEQIDAHYNIVVGKKDFGGKIKGNISSPDISIDSSNYIQKEVNSVIDKHSKDLEKLGIDEEDQKKVKDFFKILFD